MKGGDELSAHLGGGCGDDGDKTVADRGLFFVGHGADARVFLARRPAFGDAVLEVYDGWEG